MKEEWEPSIEEIYINASKLLQEKAIGYIVRNARKEDLWKVISINRSCLPENYPPFFFEELLDRYGKAFYVAESPNGEVVGYIMNRVEWRTSFFHRIFTRSLHVVSIAVLPEHRRRGLGYALMAYGLKAGREEYGCRETYLEVRVSNKPAITLYEKLGYRIVKVLAHYYIDGEDAYLMARAI